MEYYIKVTRNGEILGVAGPYKDHGEAVDALFRTWIWVQLTQNVFRSSDHTMMAEIGKFINLPSSL